LDVLANAGRPDNWFGVVTDTGKKDGTPVVQGPQDPCPGAYVLATSLHLPGPDGARLPDSSPFKYIDSATVPFVVVPLMIIEGVEGVVLGCRAVVTNTNNGRSVEALAPTAARPISWARSVWLARGQSAYRSTRRHLILPTAAEPSRIRFAINSFLERRRP
jgi:hypothetical protein